MTDQATQGDNGSSNRGLIWLMGVTALLLLGLVLFRVAASKRVSNLQEEIRAAGFPVTGPELDRWYVSTVGAGAVEGAPALLAAITAADANETAKKMLAGKDEPPLANLRVWDGLAPLSAEDLDAVRAATAATAGETEAIHAALQQPISRYPVNLTPGINALLPHLSTLRSASRFLQIQALAAAADGRDDVAWQRVLDLFVLAETLREEPIVISQLVRCAIDDTAFKTMQVVLRRGEPPPEMRQQLLQLLADAEKTDSAVRAIAGEAATTDSAFELVRSSPGSISVMIGGGGGGEGIVLAASSVLGILDLDQAFSLRYMILVREALAESDPAKRAAAVGATTSLITPRPPRYCIVSAMMLPAVGQMSAKFDSRVARFRILALALDPSRPAPADPFDGKPLRQRSTPAALLLYSIGPNRKDDGGVSAGNSKGPDDIIFEVPVK